MTYDCRQLSSIVVCVEFTLNAFLLKEKPPAAPELDLPCHGPFLKTADRGRKRVVVRGIHVIDDHFGQRLFLVEFVKKRTKRLRLIPVPDSVISLVRTKFASAARVHSPQCAKVQLLGPASFGVQPSEK